MINKKELGEALEYFSSKRDTAKNIPKFCDNTRHSIVIDGAAKAYHDIMDDLTELIEAREKAAPGEWRAISDLPVYAVCAFPDGEKVVVVQSEFHYRIWDRDKGGCKDFDARFITKAANIITSIERKVK